MMEIVFGRSAYGTMQYMGIDPTDLYCLAIGLSMGDLTKKEYPDLSELKARAEHGEELRIWYSRKSPDEYCGFCWLMAELKEYEAAERYVGELPASFALPDGCIMTCNDWGSVEAEHWQPLLQKKTKLSQSQTVGAAMQWQELLEENAPLRAIVNGSLVSVPADFYDFFLLKELERESEDFMEARLIGRVMRRYQLGIGDLLLHERMEFFIQQGMLEIISPAAEGKPILRRILRKTAK